MLFEVYYEHYVENCRGRYWEEKKSTPYMVLIRDKVKREDFRTFLIGSGFRCVSWNDGYPGVLVNLEFRRFGLIHRACKFSCVDDRNYSLDEFMTEIFIPWRDASTEK